MEHPIPDEESSPRSFDVQKPHLPAASVHARVRAFFSSLHARIFFSTGSMSTRPSSRLLSSLGLSVLVALLAVVFTWCGAGVAFLQPNEQLVLKGLSTVVTSYTPVAPCYYCYY